MYINWEYKIEHWSFTIDEQEAGAELDYLTTFGNKGWELISSTVVYQSEPDHGGLYRDSTVFKYVFKRPYGWEPELAIINGREARSAVAAYREKQKAW